MGFTMITSYLTEIAFKVFSQLSQRSDREKVAIGFGSMVIVFLLVVLIKSMFAPSDVQVGDLDLGKNKIETGINNVKESVEGTTAPNKENSGEKGLKDAIKLQDSDSDGM